MIPHVAGSDDNRGGGGRDSADGGEEDARISAQILTDTRMLWDAFAGREWRRWVLANNQGLGCGIADKNEGVGCGSTGR